MGAARRLLRIAGPLAVLFATTAYLALGSTLTLEYVEEGSVVYPSWLASLGAVPYRDFSHLYGPMLFALNGALFRWFGANLLVIRISLVLLRTITLLLTYLLARQVASRVFALLACILLLTMWGLPVDVFNIPYANHYSITLTLAAVLCFLSLPRRFGLGCALAGLFYGCAATFKTTAGAFGFAGFGLFLILAKDYLERDDAFPGLRLPSWVVTSSRLAILGTLSALLVLYLQRRNTIWNVIMLFSPALLTLGIAVYRELRDHTQRGARVGLWGLSYAAAAAAIPIAATGIYFAAKGAAPALVGDLFHGLPEKVTVLHPFPLPNMRAAVLLSFLAAVFAVVGRRRFHLPSTRYRLAAAIGLLVPSLILVANHSVRTAVVEYVQRRAWYGDILTLWYAVPVLVVSLTGLLLLRASRRAATRPPNTGAVLILYCNGITSLLLLHPNADIVHVVMDLPAFVPLMAFLLERFYRSSACRINNSTHLGGAMAAGLIGVLAVCLTAFPLDLLIRERTSRMSDQTQLKRATGIRGQEPQFGQVAAVVAYIDATVPPDQKLLALNCEELLYVLAGRRSVLDRHEFVFYLVCTDEVSAADARDLVDQRQVIETLAEDRPVIVEGGEPWIGNRLRAQFEAVSRYIDEHYKVAARIGGYRILTWEK